MTLDEELAELGVGEAVATEATGLHARMAVSLDPSRPDLAVVGPDAVNPMAAQWAKWRDRFAEAMDGSFHTIEGLEKLVLQGRVQFWPGRNAAIVTEVQEYVGGEKALQGLWAAGDLAEVMELIPGAEAYGRLVGCTSVLIEGRAGWTRPLKALGYAPWSVTLRKAL